MQPRSINQVRLPGIRHVTEAAGLGWAVTERESATVHLFDHDLRRVTRLAAPLDDPPMTVSATRRLVAAGDDHQIVVLDHDGAVRWRSSWDRLGGSAGGFHLDGDHVLWIRLGDALVAVHGVSGAEIRRTPLPGPEAAWFVHSPEGDWTGLTLLDPDQSRAMLIRLDAGRIVSRPLAGGGLAGFSPAGGRYVTPALDGFLSVRDVAFGAVIAEGHLEDLPGMPPSRPSCRDVDRAVFLTEDLILTALTSADLPDDAEEHLLLSALSLRCRSRLRYPHHHGSGAVHPSYEPGRWLTRHHEDDQLRLWQLGARLDDEPMPGQLALL
ncbi:MULTISPECIES: PQQ-like beta-propeller repeat protein [unclassified Micromonospora]|uniref:PQQ-like beta-propeller repeat protein n=1 Tax=unclassified Micromonospora TaxID=2617518 RepID=UPI001C2187A2|nr:MULTISPECIES: PQQ-like beta-propeller repeat protein [unclassified Micromonospora]MBU8860530.1 PQQ-like beta-propeller repeat protein [Micromonospora sp. WMMB482]MDM4780067.1 PQQ-like beta-propeller repeat protein [Micromonospora sp. b486]